MEVTAMQLFRPAATETNIKWNVRLGCKGVIFSVEKNF